MNEIAPAEQGEPATLNLAMIGNCTISALIDGRARIVWCCMPRFDSNPVFCALVDSPEGVGRDGTFSVEIDQFQSAEQSYDAATAILRTRLADRNGQAIEVVDFSPRFFQRDRTFRPAQLIRRIRPLSGRPRIRLVVRPRDQWGASMPSRTRGSHHLRFSGADGAVRLTTNAALTYLVDETWFLLHEPISLLLGPDETLSGGIEETARAFEEQTSMYWRRWTRRLALPPEWQDAVIRSAITLKLCQYEETGAIVAAMTTSIPEAPDSQRNWDYRFCWLRDAFFVVRALNSLSEVGTMEDYLRWLQNVVRASPSQCLQPLYGIGLESSPVERSETNLRGYRGMGPVRVGNQAYEHLQNDVYGNVVLGSAQAFYDLRLLRRADFGDFETLEAMGDRAWELYDKPDAGMWELRNRSRVHTSSSLMCWAACDRLAKIAARFGSSERASHWTGRAESIRTAILRNAWSESRRAFAASFGGSDLDASVLLMAEVGFLDPRDERFVQTVQALEQSLCSGPFMRRYESADDFGIPQVSFNACSFWRIDALASIGQEERARTLFESMLACRNHAGLLSEDIDPGSGQLWGNFPQTYSMVGIVNCAVRLSRRWESLI